MEEEARHPREIDAKSNKLEELRILVEKCYECLVKLDEYSYS